MQIGVICVRAKREPALLTSPCLVAPDDQGGDSCSMSSTRTLRPAGRRGGERFFQSPCSRRKTVTRSMYGWGGAALMDTVACSNATVWARSPLAPAARTSLRTPCSSRTTLRASRRGEATPSAAVRCACWRTGP